MKTNYTQQELNKLDFLQLLHLYGDCMWLKGTVKGERTLVRKYGKLADKILNLCIKQHVKPIKQSLHLKAKLNQWLESKGTGEFEKGMNYAYSQVLTYTEHLEKNI